MPNQPDQDSQEQWVTLARIVRPQGRRGEVLADLLTDFPEQFTASTSLSLLSSAGVHRAVTVENHWMPTGRNAGRVVLKLAGTDSISDAETLAGAEIQLPADQRVALEEGTYYVSDLVGCAVDEGDTADGMEEGGRDMADAREREHRAQTAS